jgi:serine/threonine protein kinase
MVFETLGDNLLTLIKAYKYRGIPEPMVKKIVRQVALGLDFLHRKCNIIHTDLKPENVLLSEKLPAVPLTPDELEGVTCTEVPLTPEELAAEVEKERLYARKHGLPFKDPRLDMIDGDAHGHDDIETALEGVSGEERRRLRKRLKKKRADAQLSKFAHVEDSDINNALHATVPVVFIAANFVISETAASPRPSGVSSSKEFRVLTASGQPLSVAGEPRTSSEPLDGIARLVSASAVVTVPSVDSSVAVLFVAERSYVLRALQTLLRRSREAEPASAGACSDTDDVSGAFSHYECHQWSMVFASERTTGIASEDSSPVDAVPAGKSKKARQRARAKAKKSITEASPGAEAACLYSASLVCCPNPGLVDKLWSSIAWETSELAAVAPSPDVLVWTLKVPAATLLSSVQLLENAMPEIIFSALLVPPELPGLHTAETLSTILSIPKPDKSAANIELKLALIGLQLVGRSIPTQLLANVRNAAESLNHCPSEKAIDKYSDIRAACPLLERPLDTAEGSRCLCPCLPPPELRSSAHILAVRPLSDRIAPLIPVGAPEFACALERELQSCIQHVAVSVFNARSGVARVGRPALRMKTIKVPKELTEAEKSDANERFAREFSAWEEEVMKLDSKIVDLGNACWVDKHFSEDIQTRQYRSPEVLIGAGYDTSADIWSLGCMTFELLTGDLLFDPQAGDTWTREEDHLAQMMELVGKIPRHMALAGKLSKQFFNRHGDLKNIRELRFWGPASVLHEKYAFPEIEAAMIESFLKPALNTDPERRATALDCAQHPWLMQEDDGSFVDFGANPDLAANILNEINASGPTNQESYSPGPVDLLSADMALNDAELTEQEEEIALAAALEFQQRGMSPTSAAGAATDIIRQRRIEAAEYAQSHQMQYEEALFDDQDVGLEQDLATLGIGDRENADDELVELITRMRLASVPEDRIRAILERMLSGKPQQDDLELQEYEDGTEHLHESNHVEAPTAESEIPEQTAEDSAADAGILNRLVNSLGIRF